MIKIKSFLLAIIAVFLCSSCTRTLYSTQQVLDAYKTKDDVIHEFGLPTEKREEGYTTEWLYDYGTVGIGGSYTTANANASASVYGNSVYGRASGSSATVSTFTNYRRFVKFTFERDRVARWQYQGVDLSVKKAAPGKTIALVLVGIAALVVVIIAASAGGDSGD